jgi:hypothetical protein
LAAPAFLRIDDATGGCISPETFGPLIVGRGFTPETDFSFSTSSSTSPLA